MLIPCEIFCNFEKNQNIMQIKLTKIFFLALFFATLAFAGNSAAQNMGSSHFQQMLNELDQKIATMEKLASQFPNTQLTQKIQTVKQHRRKALQFRREKRYRAANQELRLALELCNSLIKHSLGGAARNYQANLDEMIRRAEMMLHQRYNADADRLLKRARQVRTDAASAFQRGNFNKAGDLYKVEKSLLENCLKILDRNMPEKYAGLQTERENFRELKTQAEKCLQRSRVSLAVNLYNQAIGQSRKAEQAFKKGNLKQANLYYQWSVRFLLRVINLSETGNYAVSEQAKDDLQLTDQIYQATVTEYSTRADKITEKIFEQVRKLLFDARTDFNQRKYASAIQKSDVARKILTRIRTNPVRQIENYNFKLKQNIRDLQQSLQALKKDIRQDEASGTVFHLANLFLRKSRNELSAKNLRKSAAYLLVANRLTLQLQKMPGQTAVKSRISKDLIKEDYRNFRLQFRSLDKREIERNENKQLYYRLLLNLNKKIRSAIRAGRLTEADQYLSLARNLIDQIK